MKTVRDNWTHYVRAGDILKAPNGLLRVVRKCSYSKRHPRAMVCFTIRHCSWTGRCYTSYDTGELKRMGYRPVKARYRLRSQLDWEIAENLKYKNRFDQTLHCCDVRGIA